MMNNVFRIVLTGSLLLNMVFVGFAAVSGYKAYQQKKVIQERRGAVFEAISPEKRQDLQDVFQQTRKDLRQSFHDVQIKQNAVKEALTKEEFNPEIFKALIEDFHSTQEGVLDKRTEAAIQAASKLSAEERKSMAPHLLRMVGVHSFDQKKLQQKLKERSRFKPAKPQREPSKEAVDPLPKAEHQPSQP